MLYWRHGSDKMAARAKTQNSRNQSCSSCSGGWATPTSVVWNFYCNSYSGMALPGDRKQLHAVRSTGRNLPWLYKLSKDSSGAASATLATLEAYPIHSSCFKTSSQEKAQLNPWVNAALLPLTPGQVSHGEEHELWRHGSTFKSLFHHFQYFGAQFKFSESQVSRFMKWE